jgi:hypothetical protein
MNAEAELFSSVRSNGANGAEIEKEVLEATRYRLRKPDEQEGRYLVKLARAALRLGDGPWHDLSGFAQRWANSVVEALERGETEIPGFNGSKHSTKKPKAKPYPYTKSKIGDREIIYRLLLEKPDATKEQIVVWLKQLNLDHEIPVLTVSAARKGFVSSVNFLNDNRLLSFRWRNQR